VILHQESYKFLTIFSKVSATICQQRQFLRVPNTDFCLHPIRVGKLNMLHTDIHHVWKIFFLFCSCKEQTAVYIWWIFQCNLHTAVQLHLLLAPSSVISLLPSHGAQTLECNKHSCSYLDKLLCFLKKISWSTFHTMWIIKLSFIHSTSLVLPYNME